MTTSRLAIYLGDRAIEAAHAVSVDVDLLEADLTVYRPRTFLDLLAEHED
jgi:hypothetical protein